MKADYDTQHFANVCQGIMGCSNAKEANTMFENGIKPYVGEEESEIMAMQTGSGSSSKSPPKTGYQKILKGVKNTKHVLITLTLVTFLFVYFAKNYNANTFKSVSEFWKTHQDNLMRKMQTMLGSSQEKVQEMWTYFTQMKIFTMIGQVVQQSKENVWTIVNYVRTKGAYILSLLITSSKEDIDMEQLRRKVNPFELFNIDPLNYNPKKMKKQIEEVSKLADNNPKMQKALQKIGEETIISKEQFAEIRSRFFDEKTLKTMAEQMKKGGWSIGAKIGTSILSIISIISSGIILLSREFNKKIYSEYNKAVNNEGKERNQYTTMAGKIRL